VAVGRTCRVSRCGGASDWPSVSVVVPVKNEAESACGAAGIIGVVVAA